MSLLQRIASRDERSFADRVLVDMRQQFGGHAVKGAEELPYVAGELPRH